MSVKKENVIGIDLGTTNSAAACMGSNGPEIINNNQGKRTTPSVFAITKKGEEIIGEPAKRQAITDPLNTLFATKRIIGKQFDEPAVKNYAKSVAYEIVRGKNGQAAINLNNETWSVEKVASKILQEMREISAAHLGVKPEEIKKAVVTVPAYFNDQERTATKNAGAAIGLDIIRVINEPTAAALAYGLDKKQSQDSKIAVYDLGGGTFDISIIEIAKVDGETQVEVLSTNGDTSLGGEDFDNALINYCISQFKAEQGIDLSQYKDAKQRLKEAVEKAKIELSSTLETTINIPFITADSSGPKHLDISITRAKLEGLVQNLIARTIVPCETALKDAKLNISQINEVILVGGQTRMPKVQEAVEKFFGRKPRRDINPDEAVALGAAIQAGVLSGDVKDVLLLDVTPLSLGIETQGGITTKLIEKNTTIPTKAQQVFSTAENNQTAVTIHILQGEREMASGNKSLGRFDLTDIPPAPRGTPQIEVTFEIDADSILHVSAKDKTTGKEQSIKVTGSGGLTPEEIEKMKQDAEQYKEKDQAFVQLIQTKNTAQSILDATVKAMKDAGDKITSEEKEKLEVATKALEEVLKSEDKAAIEEKLKILTDLSGQMSERLYAAPTSETAQSDTAAQTTENDADSKTDAADAEFEEVKDKSEE